MSLVNLYWNIETNQLLQSSVANADRPLPDLFWTERIDFRIWLVRPKPTGGVTSQIELVDTTGYSLQMFLGKVGDPWVNQLVWTNDTVNKCFTGTLVLDNATLTAKFTGSVTILSGLYLQLHLIGSGKPRIGLFEAKLKKPVNIPGALSEDAYTPPDALVTNLALILQTSGSIAPRQEGDEFFFDVILDPAGGIELGLAGLKLSDNAFGLIGRWNAIDPLRLESPFAEGSITNAAEDTGSVSETFLGTEGVTYLARFRVRGFMDKRTYPFPQVIPLGYDDAQAICRLAREEAAWVNVATNAIWKLVVSDPPQVFYLNSTNDASDGGVVMDYVTPPIRIKGNATLTLSYDVSVDGAQHQNAPNTASVPGVDFPEDITAPFCQIDQIVDLVLPELANLVWRPRVILTPSTPMQKLSLEDDTEFLIAALQGSELTVQISNDTGDTVAITSWTAIEAPLKWVNGPAPVELPAGGRAVLKVWNRAGETAALWLTVGAETEYQALNINATGSAVLAKDYHCRVKSIIAAITGSVYETPYTYNLAISTKNARAGDLFPCRFDFAANRAPTINIRNATTGGTILLTLNGAPYAQSIVATFIFDGTAWQLWDDRNADGSLVSNKYRQEAVAYATTVTLDFDKAPFRTLTLTGNVTLATTGRATDTKEVKVMAVLITASGGDRTVALASGIKAPAGIVGSIPDGGQCWFSFTSMGPNENQTHVAALAVS